MEQTTDKPRRRMRQLTREELIAVWIAGAIILFGLIVLGSTVLFDTTRLVRFTVP